MFGTVNNFIFYKMRGYYTSATAEELKAHQEQAKIDRQRYLANPALFLLEQTIDDLKQIDQFDNIKLYQINCPIANGLPTLLDAVPSFLQSKDNLKTRITEELFMFDKDCDCSFAMGLKLDNYYVYVDFNYSGSGFRCCQTLTVYFADSINLLTEHIPANQLAPKVKIDVT